MLVLVLVNVHVNTNPRNPKKYTCGNIFRSREGSRAGARAREPLRYSAHMSPKNTKHNPHTHRKDTALVYSTDPTLNKRCDRCKEVISECTCAVTPTLPEKITAVIRVEKAHRGGKSVTVIDGLPPIESYLKSLAKELKGKMGTGGTWKIQGSTGAVEIQGERREEVREYLKGKGFQIKGY